MPRRCRGGVRPAPPRARDPVVRLAARELEDTKCVIRRVRTPACALCGCVRGCAQQAADKSRRQWIDFQQREQMKSERSKDGTTSVVQVVSPLLLLQWFNEGSGVPPKCLPALSHERGQAQHDDASRAPYGATAFLRAPAWIEVSPPRGLGAACAIAMCVARSRQSLLQSATHHLPDLTGPQGTRPKMNAPSQARRGGQFRAHSRTRTPLFAPPN